MPVVLAAAAVGILVGGNTIGQVLWYGRGSPETEDEEESEGEEEEEEEEIEPEPPAPIFVRLRRNRRKASVSTRECTICMSGAVATAFGPCRHSILCEECALKVRKCPLCREQIKTVYQGEFETELIEMPKEEEQPRWWHRLGDVVTQPFSRTRSAYSLPRPASPSGRLDRCESHCSSSDSEEEEEEEEEIMF